MSIKTKIIDDVIKIEGGYVNHPYDRGGPTKYGITEQVAQANGYAADIKNLPYALAFKIYQSKYWDSLNLDRIEPLSALVAAELFDTGVNMGIVRAGKFFQTALNALNRGQRDYKDIVVDGKIGNASVAALKAYLDKRNGDDGIKTFLKALNVLQGYHYLSLAANNETQEDFVYGWLKRVRI